MKKNNLTKKIVCIGGGTGTFVVLRGLKFYPFQISAVVAMSDSGGSNKRIRDEFGLLPTSDVRQCMVALSEEKGKAGLLRKLFMYRFDKGNGISGMTFGNLFMAALSDILGSQASAIKETCKVLKIAGTIIPVSYTDTNLCAQYEDGSTITEEHFIDEPIHDGTLKITRLYLDPAAQANPDAINAIHEADLVVLGPGDLYTSLLPNLLVTGIRDALCESKATKVYIMNLMTKYGQTYNFTALDHMQALEKYIGKCINYVIVNSTKLSQEALNIYGESHEQQVTDNLGESQYYKIIRADVVNNQMQVKTTSDTLVRSLIRHDSDKLAELLAKITNY